MTHPHDTSTPSMSTENVKSEDLVLVPREPSKRMVKAGKREILGGSTFSETDRYEMAVEIYHAMIAAAPALSASHPAKEGGEAVAVERLYSTCTMGVGCETHGVCYADAGGQPDRCAALPEAPAAPATQPGEAVREAAWKLAAEISEAYENNATQGEATDMILAAFAALSVPSPAGEAGEPVAFISQYALHCLRQEKEGGYEARGSKSRLSGDVGLYAHPTPADTARLREDLEREKAERLVVVNDRNTILKRASDESARLIAERDDARKALSWLIKDTLGPDDYSPRRSYTLTVSGKAIIDAQVAARSAPREATR